MKEVERESMQEKFLKCVHRERSTKRKSLTWKCGQKNIATRTLAREWEKHKHQQENINKNTNISTKMGETLTSRREWETQTSTEEYKNTNISNITGKTQTSGRKREKTQTSMRKWEEQKHQ